MRVYIAAPYAARTQVRSYVNQLERIGFSVVARWFDETHEIADGTVGAATGLPDDQVHKHASDDLWDISQAELFVLLTESVSELVGGTATSGGRHVETGYFMAKRGQRHVVVVGEPENIFHRLAGVTVVPTWHEAVIELASRLVAGNRPRAVQVLDAAEVSR